MTAESECVGQGDVYRALLRFVKSKVEVVVNLFVLILGVVIDGGGTMSFCTDFTQKRASRAPVAPSRCPVIDLVELMFIL